MKTGLAQVEAGSSATTISSFVRDEHERYVGTAFLPARCKGSIFGGLLRRQATEPCIQREMSVLQTEEVERIHSAAVCFDTITAFCLAFGFERLGKDLALQ